MKRHLYIIRHAKSAHDTGAPTDHARPLNGRGRRDAPRVAERMVELGWVPERVLSSDSTRTRQTWEGMRAAFDTEPEVHFTNALYLAGADEVLEELWALDDEIGAVAVLGHNPGWEAIVRWLSGVSVRMTTANVAHLVGEGDDWQQALKRSKWRFDDVIRPKELP